MIYSDVRYNAVTNEMVSRNVAKNLHFKSCRMRT